MKQEVINNLSEVATAEENKLQLALQFLDKDAAMFDEFLKESDKSSVQAIKMYFLLDHLLNMWTQFMLIVMFNNDILQMLSKVTYR